MLGMMRMKRRRMIFHCFLEGNLFGRLSETSSNNFLPCDDIRMQEEHLFLFQNEISSLHCTHPHCPPVGGLCSRLDNSHFCFLAVTSKSERQV